MANESNYTIVLLQRDNTVPSKCACPKCHNDEMDTLELDDDDNVKCLDCGTEYKI